MSNITKLRKIDVNKFLFDRYMKTSNNLKHGQIRSKLGVSAQ